MSTRERLMIGAAKMGELWLKGERCAEGWRSGECSCNPETMFCRAKKLWIRLALENGRMIEDGEFDLALLMTGREWDHTGLSLNVEFPEVGIVKIGSKGMIRMADLAKTPPETLASVLKILKNFPDSLVTDEGFPGPKQKPLASEH